jgi:NADH dehydrogenase FAD-containing subunit
MKRHVVILGAGFGGLELSTLLSEQSADELEVTLIDQHDAFILGFSKHAMRCGLSASGKAGCGVSAGDGALYRSATLPGGHR